MKAEGVQASKISPVSVPVPNQSHHRLAIEV